jgi:AcrR family transcriptional regulator
MTNEDDLGADHEKRTGRPRDPAVDEAVSHAVFKVLAECGMAGFTVEKVAAAAGVGKATVYRRWPSREDLIQEIWQHVHDDVPPPDTGDLKKDLLTFVGGLASYVRDPDRRLAISHLVAAAKVEPELGRRFHAFKQQRVEAVRQIVGQARRRGDVRPKLDDDVIVEMIVAGVFFRLLIGGGDIDERYVDQCVEIVVEGISQRR